MKKMMIDFAELHRPAAQQNEGERIEALFDTLAENIAERSQKAVSGESEALKGSDAAAVKVVAVMIRSCRLTAQSRGDPEEKIMFDGEERSGSEELLQRSEAQVACASAIAALNEESLERDQIDTWSLCSIFQFFILGSGTNPLFLGELLEGRWIDLFIAM